MLRQTRSSARVRFGQVIGAVAILAGGLPQICAQDGGPSVEVVTENTAANAGASEGGETGDGVSTGVWRLPAAIVLSANVGWNSNVNTVRSGQDRSWFTNASITASYPWGTERTRGSISAGTGMTYYPEVSHNRYDPNVFLDLTVSHNLSQRATLSGSISARYQEQPDLSRDLGFDRRAGAYVSNQDALSLSYQWLPRFSTVTSYSLGTILFENGSIGNALDRITQGIGQEFRFLYLPVTTLVAEYRFGLVTYRSSDSDSQTHTFLVGLDHTFSQKLHGTLRAGAAYRLSEDRFDATEGFNPHAEASLNYAVTGKTSLGWSARYAVEESYIPSRVARGTRSFSTGLQGNYAVTPRISSTVGCYYRHHENDGGSRRSIFGRSSAEDAFDLSLGVSYFVGRHLSLNTGFSYTEVESDIVFRSYSRETVFGGLSLRF